MRNFILSVFLILCLVFPVQAEKKDVSDNESILILVYESILKDNLALAEKQLQTVTGPSVNTANYHLYSALINHKKGEFDKALVEYFKATHFDKDNLIINYNLALLFQEMNNNIKALELYQKIIKDDPQFLNAYFNAAKIYQEQGEYKKAKGYYEKYLSKNPEDVEALNNLAVIYKDEDRIDKSKKLFNQILEMDPGNPSAHYNMALISIINNDKMMTQKELKLLKKISPEHAKILEYQLKQLNK